MRFCASKGAKRCVFRRICRKFPKILRQRFAAFFQRNAYNIFHGEGRGPCRKGRGQGLSVERYLLVNVLMDALVLALGLRLSGLRVVPRRLFPAALLGALYALLCAVSGGSWPASLPAQAVVLCAMLRISAGKLRSGWCCLFAATAVGALCIGGTMGWLLARFPGTAGYAASALAGALALWLWRDRRQMSLTRLTVCVCVRQPGSEARFEALIDTGNRLREPISGLPVVIAEEQLLADVLPEAGRGMRHIPYGGLGGCGFLEAFRPMELRFQMNGRWQDAPGVWLAVYRGRMSGRIHALAPPVFALQRKD